LQFGRVNERASICLGLFHQEVSDRNQLIVLNYIDKVRGKLRWRLLTLSVSKRMATALRNQT
jgi:hypothetical protein